MAAFFFKKNAAGIPAACAFTNKNYWYKERQNIRFSVYFVQVFLFFVALQFAQI